MQKYDVSIVNYRLGNLHSVNNVCKSVGLKSIITNDKKIIENSKMLILPGVGSFSDGIKNLKELKLDSLIKELFSNGKPIIGICLGMQLFFETSEEGEITDGLGLMKGKIKSFPKSIDFRVPHLGWSKVIFDEKFLKKENLYELNSRDFYFAHSYYLENDNKNDCILASSTYNSIKFGSAVINKNLIGFQFHPEKSGVSGIKIYKYLKKKFIK